MLLRIIMGDFLLSFKVIGVKCLFVVCMILWLIEVEFVNNKWVKGIL